MSRAMLAEALFASPLQPSDHPDQSQIQAAIAASLQTLGPSGCAAVMAQEFGDYPDTAVARMRWALTLVQTG